MDPVEEKKKSLCLARESEGTLIIEKPIQIFIWELGLCKKSGRMEEWGVGMH